MTTADINKTKIATWSDLADREPTYALVANVDLVVIRYDDNVSVLYGRCLHRGALLADGSIRGEDLVCGVSRYRHLLRRGRHATRGTGSQLPLFL